MDQLAELVVRGLVVAIHGLQAVDLLPHLVELRELLLAGLPILGRLRLLGVDLCLRPAALRLHVESDDLRTYLGLQHMRGAAVAHRDRRRALERLGELRVHLDQQVPLLRHLTVAGDDALAAPVDEGLADDGGAYINDPGARQLD